MDKKQDQLARLWDNLLSAEPERIRQAFNELDTPSQHTVLAHLQRMASEDGWQTEQRLSADAALRVLESNLKSG